MKGSKLRKLVIITAIVAGVSFAAAGIIALSTGIYSTKGGEVTSIDERRSLVLEGIDAIDTSTTSADIVIKATENREVEVHFHGTARTDNPDSIPRLVTEREGNVLYIYTERKKNISLGYFENRLVLELYIPENYRHRLTVHSVHGVIELNDQIFSILTISSTSGDVDLDQIQTGSFKMKTTSGDLSAAGLLSEKSELSSVSGNIEMLSIKGDVAVKTTSGDITLDYAEFSGSADIESTSGDVYMTLPGSAGFNLEARSTSGKISCKFPIRLSGADTGGSRNSISGDVGNASHSIKVKTVSGDITIIS